MGRGSSPPGGRHETNQSVVVRRVQEGEFTLCPNQGRGGSGRNNAQWLCAAFEDACTCTAACAAGLTSGYYMRAVRCESEGNGACRAQRPPRTSTEVSDEELQAEGKTRTCACTNCASALEIDAAASYSLLFPLCVLVTSWLR